MGELRIMNKIRLIACDMDGTLLNDRKEISQENIDAVAELKSRGIYFVIATGRHDSMIKGYMDTLGIEMPVISCNGAMVRDPFSNHLYSSIPLLTDQVFDIIEICKSFNADYHIYGRDVIFGEALTNKMYYYDKRNLILPERDQIQLFVSKDYKPYIEEHTGELFKILIIPPDPEDFDEIKKEIFESTGILPFQSDAALLDVMQKGITKAHALENLSRELKIDRNEIAAMGDYLNDLDMIKYAGTGIAMNNAVPEIKDAAQFVTERTNDQSAVAEAIKRLLEFNDR